MPLNAIIPKVWLKHALDMKIEYLLSSPRCWPTSRAKSRERSRIGQGGLHACIPNGSDSFWPAAMRNRTPRGPLVAKGSNNSGLTAFSKPFSKLGHRLRTCQRTKAALRCELVSNGVREKRRTRRARAKLPRRKLRNARFGCAAQSRFLTVQTLPSYRTHARGHHRAVWRGGCLRHTVECLGLTRRLQLACGESIVGFSGGGSGRQTV
jgi:hypothetical protein